MTKKIVLLPVSLCPNPENTYKSPDEEWEFEVFTLQKDIDALLEEYSEYKFHSLEYVREKEGIAYYIFILEEK